jgi:hypothetical protein
MELNHHRTLSVAGVTAILIGEYLSSPGDKFGLVVWSFGVLMFAAAFFCIWRNRNVARRLAWLCQTGGGFLFCLYLIMDSLPRPRLT